MSTDSLPKIGFVGVGLMGSGMAHNLIKKGYSLSVVSHQRRGAIDALLADGAQEAHTPAEIAARCDIVFLCLPSSREVEAVVTDQNGLLETAKPGMIIVDSSTADPESTLSLYEQCKQRAVRFADAPLGGTPTQANDGTLAALVGADSDVFEIIEPICKAWAMQVLWLGPVSTGHKMKLLNNFLSLTYGALFAEALAIAGKSGISVKVFDSVIRGGRMDCGFYQTFMQYVMAGDKEAHKFTLANAHKDISCLNGMAKTFGVETQIGVAVESLYSYALNRDAGSEFVPALANLIAEKNAVE